jgi:hypothetical protein
VARPVCASDGSCSWPDRGATYALGIRLGGYFRDTANTERSDCWEDGELPVRPEPFWGLNAAFLVERKLSARHQLWFAPGLGISFDLITVPEAVLSAGYRFQINRHVGVQVGVEASYWLLKVRGAVLGGLAVSF